MSPAPLFGLLARNTTHQHAPALAALLDLK
jgi:hypothetical protein